MGEIQAAGSMRIGIATESAPFASGKGGRPEGFAVDLARLIAGTLGVDPEISLGSSGALLAQIQEEELDIAFSLQPLTEEVLKETPFSDPYYLGHQRLLTPKASGASRLDDVADGRICSHASDTGLDIEKLLVDARVTQVDDVDDCVGLLETNKIDAVTAHDVLLMDVMAKLSESKAGEYSIVGDQLTTEGYGIAVAPGAGSFVEYLNNVLREAEEGGKWAESYRRWLRPYSGEPPRLPDLTAEEAAALYPGEA